MAVEKVSHEERTVESIMAELKAWKNSNYRDPDPNSSDEKEQELGYWLTTMVALCTPPLNKAYNVGPKTKIHATIRR